jgi:predicted PurR-regulated permease PerM
MSKLETVKSLSQQRSVAISQQISELRQLQTQSVETLAQQIEPLAQSLATLSDEARESILRIVRESARQQKKSAQQWNEATASWKEATKELKRERQLLESSASLIEQGTARAKQHLAGVTWRVWTAAIISSLLLALVLISVYVIWQPPLSDQEKNVLKWHQHISPEQQQQIQRIVRDNNL